MNILFALLLGLVAGIIRACQGAYKDSPYESFEKIKFARSMFIGTVGGFFWYTVANLLKIQMNPVVFLPLCIAFDSFTTEMYKRGIRIEDLSKYKMPTIFHINGFIIKNRIYRALIILLLTTFLSSVFMALTQFDLSTSFLDDNRILKGLFFGFLGGFAISTGGAMLDTAWEGFQVIKYFRSMYLGLYWGLILSFYTDNAALIVFATIGMDRFMLEFYKSFIRKVKSGKFKSEKPTAPKWLETREALLPIYNAAGAFYVFLLVAFR